MIALVHVAGCAQGEQEVEVRVFAAASLGPVFEALGTDFAARSDARITLHVAGTPRLLLALEEGARADLLATADEVLMARAVARQLVVPPPRTFAHGRLALVVPRGNPAGITGLADLTRGGLRVGLCGPEVPAGRYARQLLAERGLDVRSVSDEPSVSALLTKVRLWEVDAALVYSTEAHRAAREIELVPFEDESRRASFPLALVTGAREPRAATAFLEFVLSEDGRRHLSDFGFELP